MDAPRFRMGRLDHVHVRVPDRAAAVAWYREHLGFEPVEEYAFWAEGFAGGPVQISADGGRTTLALFEVGEGHPMVRQTNGIAFAVDAPTFLAFARSLPNGLCTPHGAPLTAAHVVDFDLCFSYDFADPWGNCFELNCDDHATVQRELVVGDGIEPVRYWPAELHDAWRTRPS